MKDCYKWLLISMLFFQVLPEGRSQKRRLIDEQDASVMQAAITNDLASEKAFDTTVYHTIVIDKQVAKHKLGVIEITTNPDSILLFSYSHGVSGLAKLIAKDSSWISIIKDFNAKEGEISRTKKGYLEIKGFEIRLVSNRFLQRNFKRKNGWKRFYNRFPRSNGIYRVSAPVVHDDKAVLYMSQSKGSLNGVGYVILLEKKERWEVIHLVELWVS